MLPVEQPFKTFTGLDGKPLENGFVYFGQPNQNPLTNSVTVYWDAAGTIPAAQPLRTSGGYIMRAGTPANVFFDGSYSELVQDSKKRQVFYARTSDDFSIAGAVGTFLKNVAGGAGASLIGFIQAAVGAVKRTLLDKSADVLNIKDFGATTASPDITAAINAAIKHCVTVSGGGEIDFPYFGTFNVLGTVLLPSHIKINLKRCTLVGNGNTMFETGYVDGSGSIVSNIGQPPETKLVTNCEIVGGKIQKAGLAFNLYNFIEGCSVIGTRFEGCTKAIYADRCFYASFKRLMARKWFAAAVTDAYTFANFVNVVGLESVAAEGYDRGWVIKGGCDGQKLLNCSSENCRIGMVVEGETSTLELDTFYFEANIECGLDLNTAGNKKITIRNSWFYSMPLGVRGGSGMFVDIDQSNTFRGTPVKYLVTDPNSDFTRLVEPPTSISVGTLAAAGVTLSDRGHYEREVTFFDGTSGNAAAKTISRNGGFVPFECSGAAGYAIGKVPFCTATKKDIATVSILTSIVNSDMQVIVYRLTVSDNNAAYELYGLIFGTKVIQMDAAGRTVTATTSGDKLVIEVGNLNIPGAAAGCEGVVRHM